MVRPLQVVYLVLMFGVMVFAGVVLFLYSTNVSESSDGETSLLNMLSLVHVVVAFGGFIVSHFLYNAQFHPKRLTSVLQGDMRNDEGNLIASTPTEKCIAIIRTALIIRIAPLEGAAFFGLVTCMVGVTSGLLQQYPEYWANLATSVIIIGFIIATFPNKERVMRIFEEKIRGTS